METNLNCKFDIIGNEKLLDLPKVAFLASQKFDQAQLDKVQKWALEISKQNKCVISGFKSKLEFEVFKTLMNKSKSSAILVLARGIYEELPYTYQKLVNSGRLLIITPFAQEQTDSRRDFAYIRNYIVVEMADEVAVGAITTGGQIEKILLESEKQYKLL